jgi:superfamily I DNA and/or RNA helicase
MYFNWTEQIMEPIRRSLLANLEAYETAKIQLDGIRAEVDLRVLNEADIIGVTTSGLARNLALLRKLQSKVLIKEEAGEIMEAHSLTAMLPSIEHMILIGDHQQLRPKAQNYDLSCENPRSQTKLDVSMFERLVQPEHEQYAAVPYTALKVQRRMHPSISTLIRSTLYPDLQDSPQVAEYPEISGMRRRLFWLDHSQPEDGVKDRSDSTSSTDQYEVEMVFALVRHLVRQGVYKATDIAVLTPYLGQLRQLRRSLSSFTEVVINERDIDELALAENDEEQKGQTETTGKDRGKGDVNVRLPYTVGVHKSTLLQALRLATIDNFQ